MQGLDVEDIRIVVQWGIDGLTFDALTQRFGRCGRNRGMQAMAVLFVDDKYYPKTGSKRKRLLSDNSSDEDDDEAPALKRAREDDSPVRRCVDDL